MSNAQHTPGPWVGRTIGQSLATVETQDGEYIICNTAQLRWDDWKTKHAERKANARLMAAAPELLEALQRLSAQCERLRLPGQPETDAEKTARAVIAKTTGGAA